MVPAVGETAATRSCGSPSPTEIVGSPRSPIITSPTDARFAWPTHLVRLAAVVGRVVRVLLGQFEEGLHLFERVVGDLRGLDRVERVVLQGRVLRIEDEHRASRVRQGPR